VTTATRTELQGIIDAALCGELNEATAERVRSFGREAVVLFALALTRRLAELRDGAAAPDPSTPPSMVAVYTKPNRTKGRKNPGSRDGHAGAQHRAAPTGLADARHASRRAATPIRLHSPSAPRTGTGRARATVLRDLANVSLPHSRDPPMHSPTPDFYCRSAGFGA